MYVKFQDSKRESEITVLPIEIEVDLLNKFKRGMSTRFGFGQEMRYEVSKVRISLQSCVGISGGWQQRNGRSGMAQYVCNNIEYINDELNRHHHDEL